MPTTPATFSLPLTFDSAVASGFATIARTQPFGDAVASSLPAGPSPSISMVSIGSRPVAFSSIDAMSSAPVAILPTAAAVTGDGSWILRSSSTVAVVSHAATRTRPPHAMARIMWSAIPTLPCPALDGPQQTSDPTSPGQRAKRSAKTCCEGRAASPPVGRRRT